MKNMHSNKFIAAIILFSFIIVYFMSSVYIVAQINHECSGENCLVCIHINEAKNIVKKLMVAFDVVKNIFVIFFIIHIFFKLYSFFVETLTPITLKVRIND